MPTITLTDTERTHFLTLLERASDTMSNAGCNDFPVENSDENWALHERLQAWNVKLSVEEWRQSKHVERRPVTEDLCFYDWFLLAYLTDKIRQAK